jgi:hypothetical protein
MNPNSIFFIKIVKIHKIQVYHSIDRLKDKIRFIKFREFFGDSTNSIELKSINCIKFKVVIALG